MLLLFACMATWTPMDQDGDGYSLEDGDCWDSPTKPPGSFLTGDQIHPGAPDAPYDAVDADCGGDDDFDQDKDGFVPPTYEGATTLLVEGSGALEGGDCWDLPNTLTDDMLALPGFPQPAAHEVFPGANDAAYDGIDQDCAGNDDFDADSDGEASTHWPQRDGSLGDDCYDSENDPFEDPAGIGPDKIYPGAIETCYDGTDQNCDGASDWDCDGDGFLVGLDCDDDNPEARPDPTAIEVWYNGIDENCDGNDADQDGDGFVPSDYTHPISAPLQTGDCWDDPTSIPPDMLVLNGFSQPEARGVHPSSTDIPYDGVDQDCGGNDDFDADRDGWATDAYVDRDGLVGPDCDDTDPKRQPDAPEDCDTVYDDNCDGDVNDLDALGCQVYQLDNDRDGFGTSVQGCLCVPEAPYDSTSVDDCDDTSFAINPGATEDCDTPDDDNCDGVFDATNALHCTPRYLDDDNDKFGGGDPLCTCLPVGDYTFEDLTDCDDTDGDINPDASEVCDDGVDNDCDEAASGCSLTGTVPLTGDWQVVGASAADAAGRGLASGHTDTDGINDLAVGGDGWVWLFQGPMSSGTTTDAIATVGGSDFGETLGIADPSGDGIGDLILGGPSYSADQGRAVVFFGPLTGTLSVASADIALGGSLGDELGSAQATGDHNDDGSTDWVVSAPRDDDARLNAGSVFLLTGPVTAGATLSAALRFDGEASEDHAGSSLVLTDTNGDGQDDLLVGAPGANANAGTTYILWGPHTLGAGLGDADVRFDGVSSDGLSGSSLATMDANADGYIDVLVGAPQDPSGGTAAGAAMLFLGPVASTPLDEAWGVYVGAAGEQAGTWVATLGDTNNNGEDDLFVGAPGADAGAGYVLYGAVSGTLDLVDADLVVEGTDDGDQAGTRGLGLGDQNGDGIDDFTISAPEAQSAGQGTVVGFMGGGF